MKRFLVIALLLTAALSPTFGQTQPGSQDFLQNMARQLRYPAPAYNGNKVAKAYVFFSVDDQGKIGDVNVLNATNVDTPFVTEIKRVMNEMPPKQAIPQGSYVLPVEFQLEGVSKQITPREESPAFIQFISGPKLLSGVVVVGYSKA